MDIKYLKHNEIDYVAWDESIASSHNALVYAQSWYLDIVSPGWEALVSSDYEYLMPLPVKRKYGIPFLVQPVLSQQLGIFSSQKIDEKILHGFIRKIPYLSYHLNLNEGNKYSKATSYPNYVLDLNKGYEKLHWAYSKNTRRNISKATKIGIYVKSDISVEEFCDFYFSVEKSTAELNKELVHKLIENGYNRGAIELYAAFYPDGELIAALCLLKSEHRLIYLLPVSNAKGKQWSGMFLIVDEIIRDKSKTDVLLDFEGSRVSGVARFYRGFGSYNKPYYHVERLSIPRMMDLFKKK
ncbi:GNAT family N-acetyltransferase [Paludibacter sp. 221]|uniref:GNAT family N-acetyltransferase n=1 Tax=Paludibacter sp. 221 TaxID=2302939 RepID=UPI0013D8D734|nr:GNAT family N-acetyltransferase [Paludibacter sp. 221]NDV47546.1 GNAT family N-acetyltransferase [Paludibacter sp. 221]